MAPETVEALVRVLSHVWADDQIWHGLADYVTADNLTQAQWNATVTDEDRELLAALGIRAE